MDLLSRGDSESPFLVSSAPSSSCGFSETRRRRGPGPLLQAELFAFLGIWLVLMVIARDHFFGDPGSLWHIVLGERMLSSGALVRADPFSFTRGGSPWVPQSWLAECLLALLHRIGGLDSIMVVTMLGLAGLYTWVAHRLLGAGIHPLLSALIVSMAITGGSYHFHPRPHILTLVFLAWTFARLCDTEAGRTPLVRLFWLIPRFILWTNVHGGMVAGVFTMAMAAAGWSLAWLAGAETPVTRPRHGLTLAFLVMACGLSALVNPFGVRLPELWFALIGSPVLPRLIQEHFPMRHSGAAAWAVSPMVVFYLAALGGVPPRRLRVTWLIPLAWLAFTWSRMRNGPLFAITAAIALGDLLPHTRWASWLARQGSEVFRIPPAGGVVIRRGVGFLSVLVPFALLATSLVLQRTNLQVPLLGRGWARLHAHSNPVELLPVLRAYERSRPVGAPIFNEMIYGGFLIYSTPRLRIFIDDRCELYGERRLLEYQQALLHDPAQVDRWAEEYGFDAALIENGSGFDRYLTSARGWEVASRTPKATLFRRLESPRQRNP
jgi:hypothetical protein